MTSIVIGMVTNVSDTIVSVSSKISFNTDKNTRNNNPYITRWEKTNTSALAENQAVGQDTGDNQHLGKIEDIYIFYGWVSNREGDATYIDMLKTFEDGPSVNSVFKDGRFGVNFNGKFGTNNKYDINPVGSGSSRIGMMLVSLDWDCDWSKHPPQAKFKLTFKVSRSDGT